MQHNFNIFLAQMYSIEEAVFLQNIYYWYLHNKRNNKNFYDNRYWTYNSVSAFSEEFIYLSEKQIRNILSKLEIKGLIITGNYNKIAYDRTKWYSITESAIEILENLGIHKEQEIKSKANTKKVNTILPNENIHFTKRANGITEKGEPIPYLNTDLKQIENNKENNNNNIEKTNLDIVSVSEVKNKLEILVNNQLELFGEYKNEMIDLYEYEFFKNLVINNLDKKYEIDKMFKSNEFKEIAKMTRKLMKQIDFPEKKTKDNLVKYFENIGKIEVMSFVYLYPYEILELRMIYNGAFLTKIVKKISNWFFDNKNFINKIDHCATIKDWCEREIKTIEKNPNYSNNEIYNYYNWGVSRNV